MAESDSVSFSEEVPWVGYAAWLDFLYNVSKGLECVFGCQNLE
jgi:hypothetical protein